ncbi:UNVERIFIED_CONTAM: Switch 2 [Sesamum latifolium]|uniref:Switch 2 n=1 Tax=Sesamum latifolium TaxID=2727402 RepID=A0AAW2TKQ4_9LAMI
MSFNAFKEALRPCKTNSSSSSCSSSSSSQIQIPLDFDSSVVSRKPPKSSLTRQLLRLQEDTASRPQIQLKSLQREFNLNSSSENDGNSKGQEEKGKESGQEDPKLESFRHLGHAGPYEPLVLSLPGGIPVVQVPASVNSRLLEHQREGVKFLYNLYRNNHGGILGDDMGLGKTIQTIAFLAAVFGKSSEPDITPQKGKLKKGPVLIICPSSVILNWESEFSKWSTFSVSVYHGPNRDLIMDKLEANDVEILITSFDTYRIQGSILSDIQWEIVVIDEAHRLKNEKSKLYIECLKIRTLKRYGLTGTIMQNKIMELFNLFDLVVPGKLGTREHFREFYDEPLKHGQRSSAPLRFIQVANERKEHLLLVLRKYMLRRTKEETIGHLMMGKEDNVVFCAMSELQKRVYLRVLQLPDIQCLVNKDLPCSCGALLNKLNVAKGQFQMVLSGLIFIGRIQRVVILALFALSSHAWSSSSSGNRKRMGVKKEMELYPRYLLSLRISNHLELIKPNPKDDQEKQRKDAEFAAAVFDIDSELVGGTGQSDSFMGVSDVRHCGKMRALERLMHSWISIGDKILLFSYSVRMLDILEKFIIRKGYSFSRLDGSTPASQRQSLVDDFNSSPSKQVFLISTRAGGLGLNLVSANRVVIFDPNWNPAQDLQAQDRSFRFGQKRHVTVFRLLAAGSLEELVYMRQVYKQQLSNIAVSGKVEKRYFEGVQDCKKFQGELFGICNLFRDLSDKLFTSEVLEFHENEGKKYNHIHTAELDLTELGIEFDPQKKIAAGKSVVYASNDPKDKRKTRLNPVLEDLGVVYAHRNEDIVNFGSGIQVEGKPSTGLKEDVNQPCSPTEERKESDADEVGVKENSEVSDSSKRRKSDHSSLLALLMGMEEVELNKLLLSDPPECQEPRPENEVQIPNG